MTKQDLSSLPVAVQFITDTGEASLKTHGPHGLPDREALQWAVLRLPSAAAEVAAATTNEERERALAKALLYAFAIGSYGTRSDNTKYVSTAGGRTGKGKRIAERNRIADSILQASPNTPVKQLQPEIAAEFKRLGLGAASKTYLYERRGSFRL
ncbi:hypothetical protein [Bradyrhizobium sp. Ai1a-2]|uniref:hypothetical protein n=1 Tax=Bradyrhizobium sp. Ai1a-2 TaxID=196490 RepID=UPI00047F6B10|nr:hypothetical protein [Bradyrhizobium sp. Ai1a-2]